MCSLCSWWLSSPAIPPTSPCASRTEVALPRTTSTSAVSPGTTLDLTDEGIYLEDQRLAASQYYLEEDQQLVKEVYWPLLQMEKGSLLIRSDEDVAYRLLEKLIFTAQEAGWESISLVAQSKSSL